MSDEAANEGGEDQVPTEEIKPTEANESKPPTTEEEGEKDPKEAAEEVRPAENNSAEEQDINKDKAESDKAEKDNDGKDKAEKHKKKDEKKDDEDELTWSWYLWQISRGIALFCLGCKMACELTGCVLIPPLERMH